MLKLKDVKVQFKDTVALDIQGELGIDKGEKVGIIGSNGAGKSTLINAIIGMVRYTGEIENQVDYENIAVHLQTNGYNEIVSVKTIIETVIDDSIKTNKKIQELIEFFDFQHCLKKRFKNLSGGEKQKLTIMLIIMQDAPLTIYDEVTTGLDFETRNNLMRKLSQIYKGKDTTMLLVSHYYEELERLVDKILLLDKGKVIAFGSISRLFRQYCGDHIVIVSNNSVTQGIAANFKKLISPKDMIALSFDDMEESKKAIDMLNREKQEYAVKYNDIEIMTLNAKHHYHQGGPQNEQI